MTELMKTSSLLCAMDGCSGFEGEVRETIRSLVSDYAETMITDPLGSLLVFVRGEKRRKEPVVLCAHTDEVGAIVFRVSKEGLLYIRPVGYMDPRIFLGKRVHVGEGHIPGVIGCKAIQLCSAAEKSRAPGMTEIYVDIGARDREDALRHVKIGDPVAFEGECVPFGDGRFMAKAIDDRLLCAILVEQLKKPLPYDTWFAFTTREEVGSVGASAAAYEIDPDLVIAVEGTVAGDVLGTPSPKNCTRLGKGAAVSFVDRGTVYDREFFKAAFDLARELDIPCQPRTNNAGRNDASAVQKSRGGARAAAISVPCRYIHSPVSMAKISDADAALNLVRALAGRMLEG